MLDGSLGDRRDGAGDVDPDIALLHTASKVIRVAIYVARVFVDRCYSLGYAPRHVSGTIDSQLEDGRASVWEKPGWVGPLRC